MRHNEVKYQTQLVETVTKVCGGYGFRLQRQFIMGRPDTMLKHPKFEARWVEVKHAPYAKLPTTISVKTSALQRQELKKMRAAGIVAGWCVFLTVGKHAYYITSMGQLYAETVEVPKKLMLWDKSEDAILTILQGL